MASNSLTMQVVLTLVDEMSGRVKSAVEASRKQLDGFAERAKQIGSELQGFGAKAAAMAAGVGAGVGVTVKAFAELEDAGAILKATMTHADGLSKNFERVSALATKLGNELPGTTKDFYEMVDALLRLKISEEDVLGGVGEAAAKLGVVMKLPYVEAATVAAKLKNAMGVANGDMLKFMDTIQRTGHEGVLATEMMYAFARSAGGLKQLAIQGEDASHAVANIYAQLISAGLSGETVGTNMVTLLNTLNRFQFDLGSKKQLEDWGEVRTLLRGIGAELEFFDQKSGQFRGVENMVAQLDKLKVLNAKDYNKTLTLIFGGGTDQQIASILGQAGSKGFEEVRKRMDNQADLQTRAAVQLDTLAAKWEAASGNFVNMLAKFGEQIAPTMKQLVDWFGDVSARLSAWIDTHKGLAEAIGLFATGVGGALAGLAAVGLTAGVIASGFGAIAGGLSAIAGAWAAAGPALLAMAANPIVLAILGIGVAAGAVIYFWDDIVAGVDRALKALRGLVEGIQRYAKDISNDIGAAIKTVRDLPAAMLKELGELGAKLKKAGKDMIEGLVAGINEKIDAAKKAMTDLGKALPDWLKKVLDIRSPSRVMAQIGADTAEGFVRGILGGIPSAAQAADALAEVVVVESARRARTAEGKYKSNADAARQGSGVLGGLGEYRDSIASLADQIKDMVVRSFRGMEEALAQFVRKGKLDFRALTDAILDDLARMAARTVTRSIGDSLSNWLASLFGGGARGVFAGYGGGVSFSARGNLFDRGALLTVPTAVPLSVMGEAGPEAVLPLARGPGGRLGVRSNTGGDLVINIAESSDRAPRVETRTDGDRTLIDVFVERVGSRLANDVGRGSGALPAAIERAYGLNRAAGAY
ncbi:MAG TPA: phage tail tape measure protein [Burkholderiales bacterium]|nr:phage tail tape measure protein [Burkholderiales bacterium]